MLLSTSSPSFLAEMAKSLPEGSDMLEHRQSLSAGGVSASIIGGAEEGIDNAWTV